VEIKIKAGDLLEAELKAEDLVEIKIKAGDLLEAELKAEDLVEIKIMAGDLLEAELKAWTSWRLRQRLEISLGQS
jgi:hypothetical protein